MTKDKIIMGESLDLKTFLQVLFSERRKHLFPNNSFPTDKMLNEYCSTIENRTDEEIKAILRFFLVQMGHYGSDLRHFTSYISIQNQIERGEDVEKPIMELFQNASKTEYYKRLMELPKHNHFVWEGMSWILDLLPGFAREAVEAIDGFYLANCQFLPDYALSGLSDATTIITAKYLDKLVPKEIFLRLTPEEFEYLIQELFDKMGFETKLTSRTNDEGIDIICTKRELANKQIVLVQCKRYEESVGVSYVRDLLGTVTDKKATKGILVCSTSFTKPAQIKAKNNPSIELIDYIELTKLLNRYVDPYWTLKLNRILVQRKQEHLMSRKK